MCSRTIQLTLSNDAFHWLLDGELPLDEAALSEAEELQDQFPDGFEILPGWELLGTSGRVAVEIMPLRPDTSAPAPVAPASPAPDFDMFQWLSKTVQLRIKRIPPDTVDVWRYYVITDKHEYLGRHELFTNKHGLQCFTTGGDYRLGKGCLWFMKHFQKADSV